MRWVEAWLWHSSVTPPVFGMTRRNAQWSISLSVSPVTMLVANAIRAEPVSLPHFPQRLQSLGLGCQKMYPCVFPGENVYEPAAH